MRIESIHIHNFRSIENECFVVEPYTLLVGANNAGKSAVIDAITALTIPFRDPAIRNESGGYVTGNVYTTFA